jgi:hypothetical protein
MLPIGPKTDRISPSKNVPLKSCRRALVGNIYYRQGALNLVQLSATISRCMDISYRAKMAAIAGPLVLTIYRA